ncbi:protealysin inhibitor emfourin [Salinicola sp. CR57]|uniref:protealysin inhibitor emfourin n=1 Tax=Salinicola sp. CR57 TaxID=1949086 RepID=UPI000DA1A234|nr:protealysin inhibitor emfourin [Salinicola sp. CR57]
MTGNGSSGNDLLEPTSVIIVTREGGFVVTPGLSAPRKIECRQLNEHQRRRLQTVLDELDRHGGESASAGADRRSFRVTLEVSAGCPRREWELDESAAPRSLIGLWKRGVEELDESAD